MSPCDTAQAARQCFAFIFPVASGHINPSLAVARSLVNLGHEVHYLCREQMRAAIEDTGATFHSDVAVEVELYEGREAGLLGALESMRKEHGLENESMISSMYKLNYVMVEQMLPGVIRWLRQLQPRAVLYCPLMNREAAMGAKVCGIPSVALLTTAGPGSLAKAMRELLAMGRTTPEELAESVKSFGPIQDAVRRLRENYGLSIDLEKLMQPVGKLDVLSDSALTLVTTSEDLQDPVEPELAAHYAEAKVRFAAVGPLLDKEGARRAAGHKLRSEAEEHREEPVAAVPAAADLLAEVRAARRAGREVVLVSMGTVITGDSPDFGWESRQKGPGGVPRGLTGRELCRAAWAGAFDAFGASSPEEGPLLVVSLGPQRDALGDLQPPANAICAPVVPQVDVLKAGVKLFLTHGGQNSFTEALASAVPVVVCPGFGDQPVNARKAEELGVGLKVDRPDPEEGTEAAACEAYRTEVASALRKVWADSAFAEAAAMRSRRLAAAGGVPRAVALVLEVAGLPCQAARPERRAVDAPVAQLAGA